ncbi:hypothetical protein ACOYW6_01815 [Parablastomonas sp. CN1-191]|uniref:hypothetical protein n=1 Tax=Parablastomonas sp. CN1-191 TaxID=3400908 RepID=UPI003BF8FCB8
MTRRRALRIGTYGAFAAFVSPLAAPQLLAFPYHAVSNGSDVWSERPLPQAELDRVTARAAALVAASPLADRSGERRHVFLTRGGWRWNWLALQSRDAFAVTRAVGGALLMNRSDLAGDRIVNGYRRTRTLSGVLAHETCHGMERKRLGIVATDIALPQWLREGYCDYVARESTLSDVEAARLRAEGRSDPALAYHDGRRRVAARLAANAGNVEAMFAAN